MKYLKQFNEEVWFIDKINKYKIDKIFRKYNITNYTINKDGSIMLIILLIYLIKN